MKIQMLIKLHTNGMIYHVKSKHFMHKPTIEFQSDLNKQITQQDILLLLITNTLLRTTFDDPISLIVNNALESCLSNKVVTYTCHKQ